MDMKKQQNYEPKISAFNLYNLCVSLIHLFRLFTTLSPKQQPWLLPYLLDQRILDCDFDFESLLVKVLHRHAAHVTHDPSRAGFLQLLDCMRGCQCDYLVTRRYTGTNTRGCVFKH